MEAIKHLDLLGHIVKDKVTGFEGIVASVDFQLYGCIQADVRPNKLTNDGKIADGFWFDINRLTVVSKKPVVDPPEFRYGHQAEGKQGCDTHSSRRA